MKSVDYVIKEVFGHRVKIVQNFCNRGVMFCGDTSGCRAPERPAAGCGGGGCNMPLFLQLSNICNARCGFCVTGHGREEVKDLAKVKMVLDEMTTKGVISSVVLTGGEPLMHPKFKEFLNLLDTYDCLDHYSLNTNGTLLRYHIEDIIASKLKYINISMHHWSDKGNRKIMGNCLTFDEIGKLRKMLPSHIKMRLACTITGAMSTEEDIKKYAAVAKSIGVPSVIFRNEYKQFDAHVSVFRRMWGKLFKADICQCGTKWIDGVMADYRESNIRAKQAICHAGEYFREFIYKEDDTLSGSWERGCQVIL